MTHVMASAILSPLVELGNWTESVVIFRVYNRILSCCHVMMTVFEVAYVYQLLGKF